MIWRILPHPALSVMLAVVWVLMANEVTVGGVLLGIVLGIVLPQVTAPFWPDRPRVRFGWTMLSYVLIVLWDILVANLHVARLILGRPNDRLKPSWIVVPIELDTPEAMAVLSGTLALAPGTVMADVSTDGRHLLIHALDVADPQAEIARIKTRYEARLKRIFR